MHALRGMSVYYVYSFYGARNIPTVYGKLGEELPMNTQTGGFFVSLHDAVNFSRKENTTHSTYLMPLRSIRIIFRFSVLSLE